MGIRQNALLRYAASLILITSGLLFLISALTLGWTVYSLILMIIYFFAIIEGILLLFPSRHTLMGVVIIVELGLVLLLLMGHNYSTIVFLPLAVGGVLAIIYKPVITESVNHPKNARRLLSLGAYLIFFAMLIDIIQVIIIIISFLNNGLYFSKGQIFTLSASIMAYTIIAGLVFLFTIFVSFRLKTKDKIRLNRYSKIAFFVGFFSIIIILAVSFLLSNYLLLILSNFRTAESLLAYNPSGFSPFNPSSYNNFLSNNKLLSVVSYSALIIGLIAVFLGSLLGLAYSKDLKLIRYISVNRKFFVYLLVYPIIIIVIAGVSLSYYSNYYIASHNELALRSLNNKILMYGGSLRYILANQSEYNSTFFGKNKSLNNQSYVHAVILYKTLVSMSKPQSNISSMAMFDNFSSNGSLSTVSVSEIDKFNFYRNTFMNSLVLSSLWNLGVLMSTRGSNLPNYTYTDYNNINLENEKSIVPSKISTLRAMYTLSGAGINDLLASYIIVNTYSKYNNLVFVPMSTANTNVTANNTGISIGFVAGGDATPVVTTTLLNGSFYDIASFSQVSNDNIETYIKSGFLKGKGFQGIDNETYLNNLFYMQSLNQYVSFFISEIFYNKTIEPNIDFFGYLNNTSIINLGNLNLNNPNITVYIDGNLSSYERYYNYLVVYNKHLSIGYHKIKVVVENSSLSAVIYISPILPNDGFLSKSFYQVVEPIAEYNSSYNYSSCNSKCFVLSLNILNTYSKPLVVENISIVGGVNPVPSVIPANISEFTYNWSANYTQAPNLIDVNYSKFIKETQLHNNYTDINYIKANYTTYNIPENASYEISRNDFITLHYLILSCSSGQVKYYTLKFDTNYGKVHSIISATCP